MSSVNDRNEAALYLAVHKYGGKNETVDYGCGMGVVSSDGTLSAVTVIVLRMRIPGVPEPLTRDFFLINASPSVEEIDVSVREALDDLRGQAASMVSQAIDEHDHGHGHGHQHEAGPALELPNS